MKRLSFFLVLLFVVSLVAIGGCRQQVGTPSAPVAPQTTPETPAQ